LRGWRPVSSRSFHPCVFRKRLDAVTGIRRFLSLHRVNRRLHYVEMELLAPPLKLEITENKFLMALDSERYPC
jgi:hypothetical protein